MRKIPYIWELEWFKKICEKDSSVPQNACCDFKYEIIDGIPRMGPKIGECYGKNLSALNFREKARYAAKVRSFSVSNPDALYKMAEKRCSPNADVYRRTKCESEQNYQKTADDFLVADDTSILMYRTAVYMINGKKTTVSDVFSSDDVFRHLGMMNGAYATPHEFF